MAIDTVGTSVDAAPPLDAEIGTSADYNDRLFTYYDAGQALIPSYISATEINEMLAADGKAASLEGVLTLPLRGAKWQFHPADGDTGECDLVKRLIPDDRLRLLMAQMTSAQIYARAYFELIWTLTDDGMVGLDDIAFRPATTCELARNPRNGHFDGFRQWAWKGLDGVEHVTIKPDRAFVYIHGTHRAPWAGVSELATAYNVFQTKQKVQFLWHQFLENVSMPKAIAQASTIDDKEVFSLVARVAKLRGGGVVGIKPGESVTPYMTGGGSGATEYHACITYLDSMMSGSVLAAFLDLAGSASRGAGSLALSKDQTDFFLASREGIAREMEVAVRRDLLTPLVRYNLGRDAKVPYLKAAPLALDIDAQSAVTLLQQLAVAPPGSTSLPAVFMDLLIQQVASYLGMDVGAVTAGIEEARAQADQTQAAQLMATVQAAHGMVVAGGVPAATGSTAAPAG